LIICVNRAYKVNMTIRKEKYVHGHALIPNIEAIGEKGMNIPIAIINVINTTAGAVVQLCMNGILCVRIRCTISVCDNCVA